jgi:hypothetical protein
MASGGCSRRRRRRRRLEFDASSAARRVQGKWQFRAPRTPTACVLLTYSV